MSRKIKALLLLALIIVFSAGCISNFSEKNVKGTTSNLQSEPITIVDGLNYTVTIKKIPQRIVSLAPSNTEILFALGLGDKIVGVTDYCNYPPEALNKTKVGGYSTINIERVVALKPDLVVAAYGNGEETIEVLKKLNLTVVALNPKNISDIKKNIELLGKITGTEKNALKLIDKMNTKIEWVKSRVKNKGRIKLAHVLWHDPIWVSGKNTFIDEIISIAGGENVFNFDGWRIVGIEDLIEKNPEVIIVSSGSGMGGGRNVVYEWVISDERLKGINAVKNGRVYIVDADIISRPSYRIADAIEIIAKFLHPEAFD
ncbi:cobalamin-binding protein [Archaeoglobales archaeon]|nr:MAG: cobalamin-binding protein [Archaeoglobales archaeon]